MHNLLPPQSALPGILAQPLAQQTHDPFASHVVEASLRFGGAPAFRRLSALRQGLLDALPRTLAEGRPIYVVADGDIALTLARPMTMLTPALARAPNRRAAMPGTPNKPEPCNVSRHI